MNMSTRNLVRSPRLLLRALSLRMRVLPFTPVLVAMAVALAAPIHSAAQQVFALSEPGTMRVLLEPDCEPVDCRWVDVDRNPQSIAMAASGVRIFQLHENGSIWSWAWRPCDGTACPDWQRIDRNPAARAITGNDGDLFQLHRDGSIWRWLGQPCEGGRCPSWIRLDRNPRTSAIVAAGSQLFQLHDDGSIWRWLGAPCAGDRCRSWEMLDANPRTRQIAAAGGSLFQRHENGSIWRWTGRACGGGSCAGWAMLDNNANTREIVAAGAELFQLHADRTIWRWRGSPCTGASCRSWERLDNNPRTRRIVAAPAGDGRGAALFQVHQNGAVWRWSGSPCAGDRCPHWRNVTAGGAFAPFAGSRGGPFAFAGSYDTDRDGLPDGWESAGYGPLRPGEWGLNPRRPDLVMVVVLRPGMTRSQVEPTLASLRRFYARVPGRNPDGSTGINLITVWGNTLPVSDSTTSYRAVYDRGMPRAWRGIAHGVLLEPGTSGGGQTDRPDWSGVSNNWRSIVHEVGHQLGLSHEPPGSTGQSPLYTSLMNYDYDHSFDGDPDAVHFSPGTFASVRLDETRLSEVLPFRQEQLHFLTRPPYNFRIGGAGVASTHVDWNRNGIFGETRVRADINDGYAVRLAGEHRLGKAAGAPSLVSGGGRLTVIYPDLESEGAYRTYSAEALSPARSGLVVARSWDGTRWSDRSVLARNAAGDPHSALVGNRLFVTFPIAGSYMIQDHAAAAPFSRRALWAALDDVTPGQERNPVLVVTRAPEELWLFLWNAATGAITYRRVDIGTPSAPQLRMGPVEVLRAGIGASASPVTSQFPVHATWDAALGRIVLATSARQGTTDGRLRVHTLQRAADGRWVEETQRWTMGSAGYSRSRARPWVLFDPARDRGVNGGWLVYHKGDVGTPAAPATTWLSRTIADSTEWEGWRTSLIGNEWMRTRSTPAAVLHAGDIAYALRWSGGDIDNELLVNLRGSGIQDGIIADHDDVTFIRTRGLRRSLGR